MAFIDTSNMHVHLGKDGGSSPLVCVIDSPDHPMDQAIFAQDRQATVVTAPVRAWNDALTPWPATRLYRDEQGFGGHASGTVDELLGDALPHIEAAAGLTPVSRGICGYSLGGLFSLYAFTHTTAFAACACLSGSVWYEGWVPYLEGLDMDLTGRFAFLSVGTKEKRGGTPLMRTVQTNMEACARILQERGCDVRYVTGPGNHLQHVPERFDAGLSALDSFLAPTTRSAR